MEGSQEVQKVHRYKDGDTRDKKGRWAGKVVTMRKEHYALLEGWQKKTGMKKAQFWREAVMRGAVEVAKAYGIDAVIPPLNEIHYAVTPERRRFLGWLFRNKPTSNGFALPAAGEEKS